MGLILADARNLLEARAGKVGGAAVTLGRLATFFHKSDVTKLRRLVGRDERAQAWLDAYGWGDYAEGFFTEILGFSSVDSIDISDYESATFIHDLGRPIPSALIGKYDLAVDGGTLEHVFEFPVAIANLLQLVSLGGIVYLNSPCNNLCGHGFYQFTPELMYRVFSESNGYLPIFVRIARSGYLNIELNSDHAMYDVVSPDVLHRRINLISRDPVVIMAMARRVNLNVPFLQPVLQSDYIQKWSNETARVPTRWRATKVMIRRFVPLVWIEKVLAVLERRRASINNSNQFRRIR
jgi:hypothetical protein